MLLLCSGLNGLLLPTEPSPGPGSSKTWPGLTYPIYFPAGQCDGRGVRDMEKASHSGLHSHDCTTNKNALALGA